MRFVALSCLPTLSPGFIAFRPAAYDAEQGQNFQW